MYVPRSLECLRNSRMTSTSSLAVLGISNRSMSRSSIFLRSLEEMGLPLYSSMWVRSFQDFSTSPAVDPFLFPLAPPEVSNSMGIPSSS